MSEAQALSALERLGFSITRQTGSRVRLARGTRRVKVPMHRNLVAGTLQSISVLKLHDGGTGPARLAWGRVLSASWQKLASLCAAPPQLVSHNKGQVAHRLHASRWKKLNEGQGVMTTSGISGYSPYFSSLQMAASGRTPTLARGQNSVCVIDDELTSQDKSLVTAAEGGVDLPNGQINMLATEIALDRYTGHLQGPVTASYIEGIGNAENRDGTDFISQSILSKALDYVAERRLRIAQPSAGTEQSNVDRCVVRQARLTFKQWHGDTNEI